MSSSTGVTPASRGIRAYLSEIPTIPNLITSLRLLAAYFIVRLSNGALPPEWWPWSTVVAIAVLATAASLTDRLDGLLARRYGWVTTVGKHLDQITDYSLGAALIYAIGCVKGLAWYDYVIGSTILMYALMVGVLRLLRLTSDSSRLAKHTAGWQMGAGCGILGSYALGWDILFQLGYAILAASMLATVFCLKGYLTEARETLNSK